MIDAFDKPGSSAAGDSAAEGTSGAAARADHKHAREAADANLSSTAGNISQIDVGDAASAGALTTGARADHQHALPTPAAASTSAVGDSATAGSGTTVARANHVHGREAFATTSDIADVAATESAGTAATVPRGDHVHADAAYAAWIQYTPAWTSTGTAPAIGNGSLAGFYLLVGKTMHLAIRMLAGTSTTYGTGSWSFSLPSGTVRNTFSRHGAGRAQPAGVAYPVVSVAVGGASTVTLQGPTSSSDVRLVGVDATHPATWTATTSNVLEFDITIELT